MKKFLFSIFLISSFTGCKFGRFVIYNFADIKDYKKFPNRELSKSTTPFEFISSENKNERDSIGINGKRISFADYLVQNKTVAFVVIKNDSVTYEKYFHGYSDSSIVTSFSMAKSVLSILVGFAIQDGLIGSVNDPVTNYVPEMKDEGFKKVTLRHLLQMTSGMHFNESYINPFGHAATYYYGRNLKKALFKMKLKHEPGTVYDYQSGSPQLLGLALERALKDKTITAYLQKKLWHPLGMEYNASWSIDKKKEGLEKTFCCLNARAMDFAKIGRFYLNKGKWKGEQLLNKEWVEESTKVDNGDGASNGYQYQWWLPSKNGEYMAQGILGQYIYVNPTSNTIIVRLGKDYGNTNWTRIFQAIAK